MMFASSASSFGSLAQAGTNASIAAVESRMMVARIFMEDVSSNPPMVLLAGRSFELAPSRLKSAPFLHQHGQARAHRLTLEFRRGDKGVESVDIALLDARAVH